MQLLVLFSFVSSRTRAPLTFPLSDSYIITSVRRYRHNLAIKVAWAVKSDKTTCDNKINIFQFFWQQHLPGVTVICSSCVCTLQSDRIKLSSFQPVKRSEFLTSSRVEMTTTLKYCCQLCQANRHCLMCCLFTAEVVFRSVCTSHCQTCQPVDADRKVPYPLCTSAGAKPCPHYRRKVRLSPKTALSPSIIS